MLQDYNIKSLKQYFPFFYTKKYLKKSYLVNLLTLMLFIILSLITKYLFILDNNVNSFFFYQNEEDEFYNYEAKPTFIKITLKKGMTLQSVLENCNVDKEERNKVLKAINKINSELIFKLKEGQGITLDFDLVFDDDDIEKDESLTLTKVVIFINKFKRIEILNNNNVFIAKSFTTPLKKIANKKIVPIKGSLVRTLKSFGINNKTVVELLNCYSHILDIQHQIKKGDVITVIIEKYITQDGDFVNYGNVLFSSLNANGKVYTIYRYAGEKKFHYFFSDGKSVKKNLLNTPIKVTKISSHFGRRNLLGYSRMHKGIDYSAPVGTEIRAAGDGIVIEASWRSGYGKCIRIRHNTEVETLYAHIKNFAKNIRVGAKVTRNQPIAYVGMTGRTTGPHLHYEVKINGKHINPLHVGVSNIQLTGVNLNKFNKFKQKIHDINKKLDNKDFVEL